MSDLLWTLPPGGQSARWQALAGDSPGGGGGLAIYGSGTDGDHVCEDGETLVTGMYHDFTIPEGVTVNINPFGLTAIFCTGTYRIDGAIDMTGTDAVDRHGVAVGDADRSGTDGGQTDGVNHINAYGAGNLGGRGGRGASGVPGAVALVAGKNQTQNAIHLLNFPTGLDASYPGGGGSGGGGDSTNYGGGAGSGGRSFVVAARHIIHGETNEYRVQGGNGADGGDDGTGSLGHGTCGGGGGGAAGWWITISDDIDPEYPANINGFGGAGGIACGDSASSSSFVGTDLVVPVEIVEDVNDEFIWNAGLQFRIAPGTYLGPNDLIPAIMQAILVDDPEFRTFAEVIPMNTDGAHPDPTKWFPVDMGGTGIAFLSPTEPDGGAIYNGMTLNSGDNDALGDLGFTDGQESDGGTTGSKDGLPGADGYVIHILNT